jgi:hypothetical protein
MTRVCIKCRVKKTLPVPLVLWHKDAAKSGDNTGYLCTGEKFQCHAKCKAHWMHDLLQEQSAISTPRLTAFLGKESIEFDEKPGPAADDKSRKAWRLLRVAELAGNAAGYSSAIEVLSLCAPPPRHCCCLLLYLYVIHI